MKTLMQRIFYILILGSALLSCSEDDFHENTLTLSGTYEGTFSRSHPSARFKSTKLSLEFIGNEFSGTSETSHYPAICRGTFEINEKSVAFIDSCAWYANFDWSLILKGAYNISSMENEITLTRTQGSTTDTYRLIKKED